MMTMVDKYLANETFEFNALLQFTIALLIIPWQMACDLRHGQSIKCQCQGHKIWPYGQGLTSLLLDVTNDSDS